VARRQVVLAGVLFEGGLGLLAVLVGAAAGQAPLDALTWDSGDALRGAAGAVPMLALLLVALRTDWEPLARLRRFVAEVVRSVLADCTAADLALLSAAAGIGEELLFRGLIQPALGAWLGPASGWVLASVLFGLAHPFSATYILVAGGMGAYLGALGLATGNLLVPIVAHALYDFAALVVLVGPRRGRGMGPSPGGEGGSTGP